MHFVNNLEGIEKNCKGFRRDIARREKIKLLKKVIGYKTCLLSRSDSGTHIAEAKASHAHGLATNLIWACHTSTGLHDCWSRPASGVLTYFLQIDKVIQSST
jgi:hypothetical protein